jgi:hypothetical protein
MKTSSVVKREIQIRVEDSQYWASGGRSYDKTIDDNNGLIGVLGPEGLKIITGTVMGPLTVAVETLDGPPPLVPQAWDVVGDADLTVNREYLNVAGWDQPTPTNRLQRRFLTPPGLHRVRVHVRGRDTASALHVVDESLEQHLLQIWPTQSPGRPVVHTDLDATGRAMVHRP